MLLSVPNYSEGRDPAGIATIRARLDERLEVLDRHSDRDHNRTVFTVAGRQEDLVRALPDSAEVAARMIDMYRHRGLHPCVGALDVCPIVWLRPADRNEARDTAHEVAGEIGELGIPVFLYGELAAIDRRRERAYFREGGLRKLVERMAGGELRPDRGPDRPHSRGGATLVTARPPLAAFNVELEGVDLGGAQAIASDLRESGGGLEGVRAIGLTLENGRTQVTTNIHDPISRPLGEVTERIRELASSRGARPVEAEIVGLVPRESLIGFPDDVPIRDRDDARQTIEGRLG